MLLLFTLIRFLFKFGCKLVKYIYFHKSIRMLISPDKIHVQTEASKNGILPRSFADDYPLNILIVDDNFVNQKLIERILSKLGYQTDTAADGVQALELFGKIKHTAILMDVRMPVMDGYEATHAIRQMDIKQPYIIAMTANVMASDREECLKNGMNNYVSKPLAISEIISKLKSAADYCSSGK